MTVDPVAHRSQPMPAGPALAQPPDRPLTVAICTVGELFGGVERHVLGMLCGLRSAGVAAHLFLFHDAELAAQARSQGDSPVILPAYNRRLLPTARALAILLAERSVDLVHVHGYKASVFCALARFWYGFAIVKTVHGLPEPMGASRIAMLRDRAYHVLDRYTTKACDAAVCYVTQDLQRTDPSGERLTVVPNGVAPMNAAEFPRPPEYCDERLTLTIVGRLEPVKGHRFAIEALTGDQRLRNVDLHIIGSGPAEEELRALASVAAVSDQVHFLGFRRNVFDYIANCDALLMPSLHEGLPYTLLEAMALGRPIIASRVGGLAEVLQNEVSALLVPPQDGQALASAIQRFSEEPALRSRLGRNALTLQRERYSLDAMTSSYLAIYRRQIASR